MAKPEDPSDTVTISISRKMRDRLWKSKEHYSETYEQLLTRILKEAGHAN